MTIHPNAELVRRYWSTAEARDWEGFAALLHPDVVYEAHQTRERVTGRDPYVRFNAEFPGDWHVTVVRVLADDSGGFAWTSFAVDGEEMTGLHVLTVVDGLVTKVDDFWPEPYDPPPGRDHLVERW
ncbi:nuclear transport factor 2 family protein [Nocardioides aestuarii]|uniref:Nuclear transport factor 2 family protein n=1 Tax=Nocardioides aestuarii TaxID=252231 RepID=A0ABW4THS8_9ACTN